MTNRYLLSVVGLVLASCGGPMMPAPVPPSDLPLAEQAVQAGAQARRVATVRHYGDPDVVEVPGTARAGEPVEIHVTTYGGGCVQEDTTVVAVTGLRADVVPYQLVYAPRAGEGCTRELRVTRRSASLTFSTAGRASVRVVGRVAPGDSVIAVERGLDVY